MPESHERRFHGDPDRLRAPERIARLEVDRVVTLSLEGSNVFSVLDVGTGTGVFAEAFLGSGVEVSAIDANPDLLEMARSIVPGADFKVGRAEKIPYPDRTFDLAFLGHVLHETDDPVGGLKEAGRVSKVRVVVLEWPFVEEEHGPPLAHRLGPAKVIEMAAKAGLGEVDYLHLSHMDLYRIQAAA